VIKAPRFYFCREKIFRDIYITIYICEHIKWDVKVASKNFFHQNYTALFPQYVLMPRESSTLPHYHKSCISKEMWKVILWKVSVIIRIKDGT
jgi:hypothetical protein